MSGAKNCPETPRQKMIGMMYLVLTAMLALNVSSDILNGFTMTNRSLVSTIYSSNMRTEDLYKDFAALMTQNETKTKPWLDKAMLVKAQADDLYNTLQEFKAGIVEIADGKNADPNAIEIENRENLDAAAQYAEINSLPGTGKGAMLRKKIDAFKEMVDSLNPSKKEAYDEIFNTEKQKSLHLGEMVSWETAMFDFMPVVAVTTLLTKYQSDVRAAEADVVNYLKNKTDASDFRVNKMEAFSITTTPYVIKGGTFTAHIVLSAVDSTLENKYFVNGREIGTDGIYRVPCNTPGTFDYTFGISMKKDGVWQTPYTSKSSYTVGEPSATISNSDLNVVYRGIDNKFDITVPGVPSENLLVSVDGGAATKIAAGKYIIRANRDGEITISVTATIEGKPQPMGNSKFRVKYLPDPKAFLTTGGTVIDPEKSTTKKTLKNDLTVVADYGPDELVTAHFDVISFTMVTIMGSANATNGKLTAKQLADIDKLEGGDNVIFKNIKAKGPDGRVRSLNPIVVQL